MKEAVKLHMVCISSDNVSSDNDRHPVPKTFTPLHYACQHFSSSQLNFTHLYFTSLSYALTPLKFPTTPFHLTSLPSLQCTFRPFLPHFYSFCFIPLIIAFLTHFLKILGLQGKVPNAPAGS
jgi:hypothetical protein